MKDFKERSGVADSVAEVIRRHKRTATLKRWFSSLATETWGVADLKTFLGPELMPKPAGKRFLEAIRVLAKRVPDAKEAVKMLTTARNDQLGQHGRTKREKNLLLQDIKAISDTLEGRQKKHRLAIHDALVDLDSNLDSDSDSGSDSESGQDLVALADKSDETGMDTSSGSLKRPCKCRNVEVTKDLISQVKGQRELESKAKLLEGMEQEEWLAICRNHVCMIAGYCKLQNNINDKKLIKRMMWIQGKSLEEMLEIAKI